MSPTNVVTSVDKMENFWVLPLGGGTSNFSTRGMLMLVRLWLVRVAGKCEVAYDEVDGTHNNLMILKHLGGTKGWPRCHCSHFIWAVA